MIDGLTGNHLWSERYDRSIDDLFELQDEVTRTIVATLIGRVEDAEVKGTARKRTDNLAAYDYFLRGVAEFRSYGPDGNRIARGLFERALVLDPGFGLAHAYRALALLAEHDYDSAPRDIKENALDVALAAVRLDPHESGCHLCLGHAYRFVGKFDLAVSHMELAVKLNPNDANAMAQLGQILAIAGRAEEGVELIRRSMLLNPYHPQWYWGSLALSLFLSRRYEEALEANSKFGRYKKAWQLARDAACLAQLERLDEARAVAAEVLRAKPSFRVSTELPTYKREEDARHMRDALLKAGLPE